jgi:glutamyl-tRNA reductase
MMATTRPPVIAFVTHARQVPAADRSRFAARLHDDVGARLLVLETCHRVEAYATDADDAHASVLSASMPIGGRVLQGGDAVRHAVAMAVGRDSVIIGEDQILHQLRRALERTRAHGALDPEIDRLFALALHAGRRARSWESGRRRSLADVALAMVEDRVASVRGREVLVVGAGRMGDLAARATVAAGASVTVSNRSMERARALASAVGGRTCALDPGPEVTRFAAILVAVHGRWAIHSSTVAALIDGGGVVVDLSVPLAVPDALVAALGPRLITADGLAHFEGEPSRDNAPDPRADALIEATVQDFIDWQARGDARATAEALVRRADRERAAELAALWRKLPTLEPEVREAIEGMTRHLAARLLRQPLERLGQDTEGVDGPTVRDLFAL